MIPPQIRPLALSALLVLGTACDKPDAKSSSSSTSSATAQDQAAALAPGQLGGLYIRQQMVPMAFGGRMTFNLQREFFYFFPDGHMLFGVPTDGSLKEHPTAADFAALKDVPAEQRGTYAIHAGQITLTREKGQPLTEPFSIPKANDDSVLQIGPPSTIGSVKAMPFKDGETLDGSYQFDGTVGLGSPNTIYNVTTLNFRPDGTLGSEHLSGVDTQGVSTTVGSSGVTTHAQTAGVGSYHFKGYTLEMTVGAKTEKATAFRWAGDANPSAPGMIYVAGRVYSHIDVKK